MSDHDKTIRISTLQSQGQEDDLRDTTAAQRMEMMWQLAVDAWAFKGEPIIESRLSRHVARVVRGKR